MEEFTITKTNNSSYSKFVTSTIQFGFSGSQSTETVPLIGGNSRPLDGQPALKRGHTRITCSTLSPPDSQGQTSLSAHPRFISYSRSTPGPVSVWVPQKLEVHLISSLDFTVGKREWIHLLRARLLQFLKIVSVPQFSRLPE